jgi:ATP-dependent DNA ligase
VLPVAPPIAPMLARLEHEIPVGDYLFEPKWDGFRCLAFRDGDRVDLRSRQDRPLARYFPELVEAASRLRRRIVLDGEIVIPAANGFDFDALLARLHPATSRVERLSRQTPAVFGAFDLLALAEEDMRERPFAERRDRLENVLGDGGDRLLVTPSTADPSVAEEWLERFEGVVAKRPDLPYLAGKRAMVKVKREKTLDCVVGGFRLHADRLLPSSLLLGLYDGEGTLRHVGVASGFSQRQREALLDELHPRVVPLAGHPWSNGFLEQGSRMGRLKGAAARWVPEEMEQDWTAVEPVLTCEVSYDQVDDDRLRHPARFRRWRPDRSASSCTFEQLRPPKS